MIPYLTQKQNVDAVYAAGSQADPAATRRIHARDALGGYPARSRRRHASRYWNSRHSIRRSTRTIRKANLQTVRRKSPYYGSLFTNDKTAQVKLDR